MKSLVYNKTKTNVSDFKYVKELQPVNPESTDSFVTLEEEPQNND